MSHLTAVAGIQGACGLRPGRVQQGDWANRVCSAWVAVLREHRQPLRTPALGQWLLQERSHFPSITQTLRK